MSGSRYLNFKWDVWALDRYMKKPLRTFEARKAQAFIVNFFVISLAIAVMNLYFFLASSPCPVTGSVPAACASDCLTAGAVASTDCVADRTTCVNWYCEMAKPQGPFKTYLNDDAVTVVAEACVDDPTDADNTCSLSSFTAGTTVRDAAAASCGAGCTYTPYVAPASATINEGYITPVIAILPNPTTHPTAASVTSMLGSPVTLSTLVIIYMTKYGLEQRHRKATMEFGVNKEADMQEQIDLAAVQLKKKDARIEYFEKQRDRAKGG